MPSSAPSRIWPSGSPPESASKPLAGSLSTMLRVTFTGEGASRDEPKIWLFDPDEVDVGEAERIEAEMGERRDWDDFVQGVIDNKVRARRVLLWHLRRRDHPDAVLAFRDVTYRMGELKVELGSIEYDKIIESFRENPAVDPDRKAAVLLDLEDDRAKALEVEQAISADPKEPLSDSDPLPPAASPLDETHT